MHKVVITVTCFLLMTTLSAQSTKAVQWMLGVWKINTPQGTVVEIWEPKNDSTIQGRSVFVKAPNDTIPQERIEMAFRNGEWYYTPIVANQNNGQPVSFKVIFIRGTEFVSENPTHDFPQRIAYRRIKQTLFASIEGKRGGRFSKQNFDFTTE